MGNGISTPDRIELVDQRTDVELGRVDRYAKTASYCLVYPRFGGENLTESWSYSADRNAAQACGYTREQCLDISQARRGGLCTRTR